MITDFKLDIPSNPSIAIKMLIDSGFEAGIIGGSTRDLIMHKKPNDFDICTSAIPEEIKSVFKDFKQLDIGYKYGTISVFINSEKIEITTYRVENDYFDGRRPNNIVFTKKLIDDLNRRDFTINAIFFNNIKGIVDPFDGVSDIYNRTIRCVGNPNLRLKEDALRILRGLRFCSTLNFNIEENTKLAMFANKIFLKNISKERISKELVKIIKGKNILNVFLEFQEIIESLIPNIKIESQTWRKMSLEISNSNDLVFKLIIFLYTISKHNQSSISLYSESYLFKTLKLSNSEDLTKKDLNDIIKLISYQNIIIEPNKESILKVLLKLKGDIEQLKRLVLFKKYISLINQSTKSHRDLEIINQTEIILNEIVLKNTPTSIKDLDINGLDLINIGVQSGKKIGIILNMLLQKVLFEGLENTREILIYEIKKNKLSDKNK